jgi:hypothetical protein
MQRAVKVQSAVLLRRPSCTRTEYQGHLIVREQERREKEIRLQNRRKKAETDEEKLLRLLSSKPE